MEGGAIGGARVVGGTVVVVVGAAVVVLDVVVVVLVVAAVVVGDTSGAVAFPPRALIAVTGSQVASISVSASASAVVNASDHRSLTEIQSTAYLHQAGSLGGRQSSGPLFPLA